MRESKLLEHVYRANTALGAEVTIPPGDDLGAVRVGGREVLAGVDQLADGVHFELATTPLAKVGRKAITRCLSDVAAMAALPDGAVVTAALPRDFGEARATELFDAMRATAEQYVCPLIGGDIAMWDQPLLLTVTVFAHCEPNAPVTRGGARPGDAVCVTGRLGGSLVEHEGCTHHLDFEPRIELARALVNDCGLTIRSMIDLSDGLARDLGHICRASNVDAGVTVDRLPTSAAAEMLAEQDKSPAWRHVVGDGEDYELCFTLPAEQAGDKLPAEIGGVPITMIGTVAEARGEGQLLFELPDGTTQPAAGLGWEHQG